MSKETSKKASQIETEILSKFARIDTSDLPDFENCSILLDMGLWVLYASKEKLKIKKLTINQIVSVLLNIKEVSVKPQSIRAAFDRARTMIHKHYEEDEVYFEIMQSGKDYLMSLTGKGSVNLFYFESGKEFTPKRLFAENILQELRGELRIADPYCGERVLDILKDVKDRQVKFLTRIENIRVESAKRSLLHDINDFKSEHPDIEFRSYLNTDMHDRYVLSDNALVILGHSIKDLGGKESFAIVINKSMISTIFETISENFNSRWKQSIPL